MLTNLVAQIYELCGCSDMCMHPAQWASTVYDEVRKGMTHA